MGKKNNNNFQEKYGEDNLVVKKKLAVREEGATTRKICGLGGRTGAQMV